MEATVVSMEVTEDMATARGRLRLLPLLSLQLMLRLIVMEAMEATVVAMEATVVATEATEDTATAKGRLRLLPLLSQLLMLRLTVMEATEATEAMEAMEATAVAMDTATESRLM